MRKGFPWVVVVLVIGVVAAYGLSLIFFSGHIGHILGSPTPTL